MKKCKHLYEFDGGTCIRCGRTVADIMDEERQKIIDGDKKKSFKEKIKKIFTK